MPPDFKDAIIVSLFKNKGSKAAYGGYKGIALCTAGKILARILLNRLIADISEENLPEVHCSFRPDHSTVDMIFVVRQVQEKCSEQNMDLNAVSIDLMKAFDTVNREGLWAILHKMGCPRRFIQIIHLFHDHMTVQVLPSGDFSDAFEIANGVKQGCVLAPVLFILFFDCVLSNATRDLDQGISFTSEGVVDQEVYSYRTKNQILSIYFMLLS
ncbi:unnamed protein product [Natator depressus]